MKYLLSLILSILCLNIYANPPIYVNSLEDAVVLQKSIEHDILLIFSSDKCTYCNILKKDLEDMNIENKIICIVDIDKNMNIKKQYRVSVIPDTRIISKGKDIKRIVGYKNKTTYIDLIK